MGGACARTFDVRRDSARVRRSLGDGARRAGGMRVLFCEDGKRGVLCEHIAEDLQEAMERVGEQDCIFEIKSMKLGLIIRVYFIKAGEMAPRYGKALIEAIARSWYRSRIWITQFVDVENEAELRDAEALLNEELLRNLKRQRDEQKKK